MSVKKLASFSTICIVFYSSFIFSEDFNEINFEFLIDNNLQRDYYEHAYSARGLWHWNKFNVGSGLKSYSDYENKQKIRLDVIGLFDLYNDGLVSVDLGAGFEGRSPKIEYAISYHLNPDFSIKAGLRQVLSRDFEENYTDFSVGFVYTWPLSLNVPQEIDNIPELEQPSAPLITDSSVAELIDTTPPEINEPEEVTDVTPSGVDSAPDIPVVDITSHIVKKDEYLYKIARMYNTSAEYLLKINEIKTPDLIYPGQVIKIKI